VPYIYGLESAIDELAVKLDMDPIELRRINDSMTDSMGKQWSSRSLMQCFDEAAAAFGWARRDPQVGSMRDGEWLVGWGCAMATYPSQVAPAAVRARNGGREGTWKRPRMRSARAPIPSLVKRRLRALACRSRT